MEREECAASITERPCTQIQLSQYYYQHASTLVSLYTALGGGWNMSHKAIMDGPSRR